MQTVLQSAAAGLARLNPLDWVIALLLAASTVAAFSRGLIRSVVSLLGLVAAVVLASLYAPHCAALLVRWIRPLAVAEVAAFALVAIAVFAAASLLGRLVRGAAGAAGLGLLDRLAGAAFGFARGVLLVAALLLPAAPLLPHLAAARTSAILPYLLPAAHGISFVLPREFGRRIAAGSRWIHAAGMLSSTARGGNAATAERGEAE